MVAGDPTPSKQSVLRFEKLHLQFDETVALDNVSLEVFPGETVVVLGAAGSGKTTLLKTAIGLVKPDSGRVWLFGQDITDLDDPHLFDIRRNVGVLFQEGGLFDSLTVEENVSYPLVNQRGPKPDPASVRRKVVDALRFVELETTLDKFPNEISGGMRRRVGIARAVVTEPPLVLYDSPTAGLDPITANTIMALVAKERDTANTANLIVTQRYQDGQLMANFRYNPQSGRLEHDSPNGRPGGLASLTVFVVMDRGRVVFQGSQAELEASIDKYVRKFVPKHR